MQWTVLTNIVLETNSVKLWSVVSGQKEVIYMYIIIHSDMSWYQHKSTLEYNQRTIGAEELWYSISNSDHLCTFLVVEHGCCYKETELMLLIVVRVLMSLFIRVSLFVEMQTKYIKWKENAFYPRYIWTIRIRKISQCPLTNGMKHINLRNHHKVVYQTRKGISPLA